MSRRRAASGFTLIEVLIALGILAIGLTVALGLLAAAATSGKRATDHATASLIAESVLDDVEARLTVGYVARTWRDLPVLDDAGRARRGLLDAPGAPAAGGAAGVQPRQASGGAIGPQSGGSSSGVAAGSGSGATETRILLDDQPSADYPGYRVDVFLTPIDELALLADEASGLAPPPPSTPDAFLAEAIVRWSDEGQRRQAVFSSVLLVRLSDSDVR